MTSKDNFTTNLSYFWLTIDVIVAIFMSAHGFDLILGIKMTKNNFCKCKCQCK